MEKQLYFMQLQDLLIGKEAQLKLVVRRLVEQEVKDQEGTPI